MISETTARQVAGRRWRSSRGVLLVVLALAALALALAALRPGGTAQDLDPTSPSDGGTRALAEILKQRGVRLDVARRAGDAAARATPGGTLVVTRTDRLTPTDLGTLQETTANLVLVAPDRHALESLAPGVRRAEPSFEETDVPGCALPAAVAAGRVEFGQAQTYEVPSGATRCYVGDRFPRLVEVADGGRTVTVLGSAAPLVNRSLAEEGNAALAMNLVGARPHVVWLIPDLPEPGAEGGERSLGDLLPFGVKLFFLELIVAVALAALWRSRRLGPVVAEALPVVVRSAETVEGRSRLYRAHRARDRAAEALRAGARERLVALLGLPRGAAADPEAAPQIVAAVAARTGRDEPSVGEALYGPEPVDDAALVRLTDLLDDLERQVRQS